MLNRKLFTSVLTGAALVCAPALAEGTAMLKGADGADHGSVTLTDTPSGVVHVSAKLTGLAPGTHGFHIHETGACDGADGFQSAGGHLAGDLEHGVLAEGGPHPGDMPNIHVPDSGDLTIEYFLSSVALEGGDANIMDDDGAAAELVGGGCDRGPLFP